MILPTLQLSSSPVQCLSTEYKFYLDWGKISNNCWRRLDTSLLARSLRRSEFSSWEENVLRPFQRLRDSRFMIFISKTLFSEVRRTSRNSCWRRQTSSTSSDPVLLEQWLKMTSWRLQTLSLRMGDSKLLRD